ncbi:MAG TPA: tetratricopeptide repeat protein [Terracidiphilus sp.]|nr:tetratricopeptide repeat protein [Terracidiphilus sp.]
MQNARTIRNRILAAAVVATMLMVTPVRAHAVSKEIVQLQTQVQQLLDMVQRLQSTMDTRFAVLQNLAQQTANQAVAMNNTVNGLQQKLNAQNEALSGKMDATSGQIQSLNDSVDELKTRIAKLQKSIDNMQGQLQNIQSQPAAMPGATGTPGQTTPGVPGQTPGQAPGPQGATGAQNPPANQAPPLAQTFQAALGDYNAARYDLASSEFQDVIHYYPMDDMAGSAQYYLGEIAYHQHKFEDAVQHYNAVLEGFSGNSKAPAAQLHKGYALLDLHRRSEGIHELRALIQRYPHTPESEHARSKLNAMGVRIVPR